MTLPTAHKHTIELAFYCLHAAKKGMKVKLKQAKGLDLLGTFATASCDLEAGDIVRLEWPEKLVDYDTDTALHPYQDTGGDFCGRCGEDKSWHPEAGKDE